MAILSTSINGTHINTIEAAASFNTVITSETARTMRVRMTIQRDGTEAGQSDCVLDPQHLTSNVIVAGEGSISLTGQLTLDLKNKAIVFEGNLTYLNHVSMGMGPIIVAVL